MIRRATALLVLVLLSHLSSQGISIDFHRTHGVIRPLHGVNSGPLCYRGTVDLSVYHRELAIPLTRLHDVPWVNAEAVDIHLVFPDFRNDPQREESYRFEATDDYIHSITNVGSRIVYRLGESIEHTPRKYHVHPPSDFEKWAAVCVGIIRHYNEGWASGFQHDIAYWEIWNEPDVRPAMWTGTDEQFFRLFEVTAKTIKQRFPNVKVGGPAVGGTGDFVGETFQPTPFLTKFLAYCRDRQVPLDFFSWHRYTSQPWDLARRAHAIRRLLDAHGFEHAESHLNEWNYLPNDDWGPMLSDGQGATRERWYAQMSGPEGAAFAATVLMALQDAPVTVANFYTGEVQGFGLFHFSGVPKSSFYAFKAFRQMLDTPIRVHAQRDSESAIAVLAGVDEKRTRCQVLVSATAQSNAVKLELSNLPWQTATDYEVLLVAEGHSLSRVRHGVLPATASSLALDLRSPAVALIQLRPANSADRTRER